MIHKQVVSVETYASFKSVCALFAIGSRDSRLMRGYLSADNIQHTS